MARRHNALGDSLLILLLRSERLEVGGNTENERVFHILEVRQKKEAYNKEVRPRASCVKNSERRL